MYLCTQRSTHVASPTLNSGSLYIATHFRKHWSVILCHGQGGVRCTKRPGQRQFLCRALVKHISHRLKLCLLRCLHDAGESLCDEVGDKNIMQLEAMAGRARTGEMSDTKVDGPRFEARRFLCRPFTGMRKIREEERDNFAWFIHTVPLQFVAWSPTAAIPRVAQVGRCRSIHKCVQSI